MLTPTAIRCSSTRKICLDWEKPASRVSKTGKKPIRHGWGRNDAAIFVTILRRNFEVEARFADHGKLKTALRAPISAARPGVEGADLAKPATEK
ncbi:hypothetical protein [Mesorhizobium sp. WSM4906]|uniref:hypothetical protein n=1 Tax=Mesorhizobium sp. WSM4906 TaxID=3038546 RepID=UPI00241720B4|nr:hypothetical protein [Mesorhizobium sp. WSM4906]WFP77753.1 hypothetical protein QAZ22_08180 [Mesorhizobium sp. WSM4906]